MKYFKTILFLLITLFTVSACQLPNVNQPTDINKISYVLDGGDLPLNFPDSFKLNEEVTLPVPTRDGYEFIGWYLTEDFNGEIVTKINEKTAKDITLYAKWEKIEEHTHEYVDGICSCGDVIPNEEVTYTIEYVTNGGELPSDAKMEYYLGENYELPIPRRAAKSFNGWYDYDTNEPVTHVNHGNIKVYALYLDATITSAISYVLDGGKLDAAPSSYEEGKTLPLPTPSKDGFYFRGWYTDSEFKEKLIAVTAKTFGDLTLYAKWEEATIENTNIAIMGDSISTFYSPTSKVNSIWQELNEYYYPKYAPAVSSVSLTWWYQTIEALGAKLLVNNSLSGSAICVGNNKGMDRMRILKNMYGNVTPDALIIYMGINDAVSGVTKDNFEKGYKQMLDLVHTNFPSCQVFICTLPYETYTDGILRVEYNKIIKKLAEEYDLPLVDLENLWDSSTEVKNNWHYLSDNIHPGVLGMQKISAAMTKVLKEFYNVE